MPRDANHEWKSPMSERQQITYKYTMLDAICEYDQGLLTKRQVPIDLGSAPVMQNMDHMHIDSNNKNT